MESELVSVTVRISRHHVEWLDSDLIPYTSSRSERVRLVLAFAERILKSIDSDLLELGMSEELLHERVEQGIVAAEAHALYAAAFGQTKWIREFQSAVEVIEEEIPAIMKGLDRYGGPMTKEQFDETFGLAYSRHSGESNGT